MAKKSKPDGPDPDDDKFNPVIGWPGLSTVREQIESRPDVSPHVLFIGPRKAADEAARQFAESLGNPIHEIFAENKGKGDAEVIAKLVEKGPLKPLHPPGKGAHRPLLLLLGLDRFTKTAHYWLKGYSDHDTANPYICVATVRRVSDLEEPLLSTFVEIEAERVQYDESQSDSAPQPAPPARKKRSSGPPWEDIEVKGTIGDAVEFVSNGKDIRIRGTALPHQMADLCRQVLTHCAVKKGKINKYQPLLKDMKNLFDGARFAVKADIWVGMRNLKVDLPVDSGEIVPTGWADPRTKTDPDFDG